jgi:hypothetical protein
MPDPTPGERLAAQAVTVSGNQVRIGIDGPPVTCSDPKAAQAHADRQRRILSDLLDNAMAEGEAAFRSDERATCVQQLHDAAEKARRFWFVRDELHAAADHLAATGRSTTSP